MKLERGYKMQKWEKKMRKSIERGKIVTVEKKKLTVVVNVRKEENVANLGSKLMQN